MEPQFLHMPFQAIECFLSNVEPINGVSWSKESRYDCPTTITGSAAYSKGTVFIARWKTFAC
jgi:hypothetical protein